jgi:hypothetical protein
MHASASTPSPIHSRVPARGGTVSLKADTYEWFAKIHNFIFSGHGRAVVSHRPAVVRRIKAVAPQGERKNLKL